MEDGLRERIEALERAVTDGEHDLSGLATEAEALDRLETLEAEYEELETQVAELEAATQALRGYVGNVRAVNEEVEARAETAISRVEALEAQLPAADGESVGQTNARNAGAKRSGHQNSHSISDRGGHPSTQDRGRTETGEHEAHAPEREHCSACGQVRPGEHHSPGGHNGGATREKQSEDDSTARVGQTDPLVSEETDDETSRLDRFRQLL